MRNQLTTRTTCIPELVYAVEGNLDGHSVELHAWSQGRITLDLGICSLSLSPAAAVELANNLSAALAAVQEVRNA